MSSLPLVSVICPTTYDRPYFNENVCRMFYKQDYDNKHMVLDYDPGNIGEKRNRLCERAEGEIILCMDSDDFYAPDWISKSVECLVAENADVVGLNNLYFYDIGSGAAYKYSYMDLGGLPWVAGATMCFWKNFWRNNPYPERQIGEDNAFLWGAKEKPRVYAHTYLDGFMATIHPNNTSKRIIKNLCYSPLSEAKEKELTDRWGDYLANLTER